MTKTITIDGIQAEVHDGETIMQVADRLGITIPRMCHREDLPKFTSCMVCQVKNLTTGNMTPSCSIPAEAGMVIDSSCDEVKTARKIALELLLSEHIGDCEAPCTIFCPAGMDIPLMIRQIAAGEFTDALKTVKADLALPAVLGRICSAPCENACRRKYHDQPVSICKLHRFVADLDLATDHPWLPEVAPATGKTIRIIGAGPMGLAAAWQLAQHGHSITLYDRHEKPGGGIRYDMPEGMLDMDVLDREIEVLLSLGIRFEGRCRVGESLTLDQLRKTSDAILIAVQPGSIEDAESMGLPTGERGVVADKHTFATSIPGLFARPGLATGSKLSIRAEAAGKKAAQVINHFLGAGGVVPIKETCNSSIGKPLAGEMPAFMGAASTEPQVVADDGFTASEAKGETARCLHCDCRRKDNCLLRDYSTETEAKQRHFSAESRPLFKQLRPAAGVILEPGKCIGCGICVRICERETVENGFTFLDRGYDVTVGTPFDMTIDPAYKDAIDDCVRSCPTGALSFCVEN